MTSTLYSPASARTVSTIPVDLYREGDTYRLDADLPGVDPSNVEIDVDGELLTIRAERSNGATGDARWLARGRRTGTFVRRFSLGRGIDRDAIAATFDNGVLSLSIPVSEKAKARKIEVATVSHDVQVSSPVEDAEPVAA